MTRVELPGVMASDSPVGPPATMCEHAHGHETLACAETDADRREQAIVDRDGDRHRADRAPAVDDRDRAPRREGRERADRDAAAADTRRRFTRGDRGQGRAIVRTQSALETRLGSQPPGDGGGQIELLRVAGDGDPEGRFERSIGAAVLAAPGEVVVAVEGDGEGQQRQEGEPGDELEPEAAQAAAALQADPPPQAITRRCRYLSWTGFGRSRGKHERCLVARRRRRPDGHRRRWSVGAAETRPRPRHRPPCAARRSDDPGPCAGGGRGGAGAEPGTAGAHGPAAEAAPGTHLVRRTGARSPGARAAEARSAEAEACPAAAGHPAHDPGPAAHHDDARACPGADPAPTPATPAPDASPGAHAGPRARPRSPAPAPLRLRPPRPPAEQPPPPPTAQPASVNPGRTDAPSPSQPLTLDAIEPWVQPRLHEQPPAPQPPTGGCDTTTGGDDSQRTR